LLTVKLSQRESREKVLLQDAVCWCILQAPTVHAGFDGKLTLEMILLGSSDMVLVPEMKICQLILEEVKGTPFPAPSQFQGQSTPSGLAPK